jgi:hypothetical protein
MMINAIPVIVDAYLKGIKNFDVDLAYRRAKKVQWLTQES